MEDSSSPHEGQPALRYYDMLTVLATTVAVCTNMLALKVTRIGPFTFGGAVVFFPITYILGDVLTEVYGFRRARRVIWLSFGAMLFAAVMSWAVLAMPAALERLEIQQHYEVVFSSTPQNLCGIAPCLSGGRLLELDRACQAKGYRSGPRLLEAGNPLDRRRPGRGLPVVLSAGLRRRVVVGTHWDDHGDALLAEGWNRGAGCAVSYRLVTFLKRAEGIDYYDRITDFNPFGLSVESEDDAQAHDGHNRLTFAKAPSGVQFRRVQQTVPQERRRRLWSRHRRLRESRY